MEFRHGLNEEQLAQLKGAKDWGKRNWKPFVAGAAIAGVAILVFRGKTTPTQIFNIVLVESQEKLPL